MAEKLRKLLAAYLPEPSKIAIYRTLYYLQIIRLNVIPVKYHSENEVVYHCCVQRTASQWLKNILSDPAIYQYSGLCFFNARMLGVEKQPKSIAHPHNSIVSPLYIDYGFFQKQYKPQNYAVFFVGRDPRDIVISHYFASRYSHTLMGDMLQRRKTLNKISVEEGIIYTIDYLRKFGLFNSLRSWYKAAQKNHRVLYVKYEKLVGAYQEEQFSVVLKHCDIGMPQDILRELLSKHQFERISGHQRGTQDVRSHYRKGTPGDWQNYFTPQIRAKFKDSTRDLIDLLGYNW